MNIMEIFCCGCREKVDARLADGAEIYPHRLDLYNLPFWKCDGCGNHVGCHHKTKNETRPLGCIPTPEIKNARMEIHKIIDPLWKSGRVDRKTLYAAISEHLGWTYHTAKIRSIDEARKVWRFVRKYA
ncbi:MAG: zinc-finger-containing protein [Thermodesulfobacteriota bacterium]|nr:zinc-finger-containing protein [Thermodesulfobacteriota bacterium]